MIITLSLNNHRETAFTVEYKEHGCNDITILYNSLSRKLALEEYYNTRRKIDRMSFCILDSKDSAEDTHTTYECLLQFVLFPANNENKL
jgi:hypothetical protein